MARAKALFNRPPDFVEVSGPLLDKELRQKLRTFYPKHDDESLRDGYSVRPADEFAAQLMDETHWAWSELEWNRECLRKEEVYATWKTLKKDLQATARFIHKYPVKAIADTRLTKLADRLWNLPRDVDLLLGIDVDVRACASEIRKALAGNLPLGDCRKSIESLLSVVVAAERNIVQPPSRSVPIRLVARELALRFIRVFEGCGLETSMSVSGYSSEVACTSDLVCCLAEAGRAIGVCNTDKTWGEYVGAAYKAGARLLERKK